MKNTCDILNCQHF